MDLFNTDTGPAVELKRGAFAAYDMDALVQAIRPEQYEIQMYGKTMPRPRLERWINVSAQRTYSFGGGRPLVPVHPYELGQEFVRLWSAVQDATGHYYDSCFANLYRDGGDSIDWHADDEDWIGPVIASVSFGAARDFQMRRKPPRIGMSPGPISERFSLGHGDLLVMGAGVQDEWLHRVPKTKRRVGPRLNLTFRQTRRVTP